MGSADFLVHALVAGVNLHPVATGVQLCPDRIGVFLVAVGDWYHHCLHWSQPHREGATVVLDENAQEPLHGTQDGPVHHVRTAAAALIVLVGQVEPLRQVEIELHRGALPSPPQGVGDVDVYLGPIEGPAAFVHSER